MADLVVRCSRCQQRNRIAKDKISPRCGVCRSPLAGDVINAFADGKAGIEDKQHSEFMQMVGRIARKVCSE